MCYGLDLNLMVLISFVRGQMTPLFQSSNAQNLRARPVWSILCPQGGSWSPKFLSPPPSPPSQVRPSPSTYHAAKDPCRGIPGTEWAPVTGSYSLFRRFLPGLRWFLPDGLCSFLCWIPKGLLLRSTGSFSSLFHSLLSMVLICDLCTLWFTRLSASSPPVRESG